LFDNPAKKFLNLSHPLNCLSGFAAIVSVYGLAAIDSIFGFPAILLLFWACGFLVIVSTNDLLISFNASFPNYGNFVLSIRVLAKSAPFYIIPLFCIISIALVIFINEKKVEKLRITFSSIILNSCSEILSRFIHHHSLFLP